MNKPKFLYKKPIIQLKVESSRVLCTLNDYDKIPIELINPNNSYYVSFEHLCDSDHYSVSIYERIPAGSINPDYEKELEEYNRLKAEYKKRLKEYNEWLAGQELQKERDEYMLYQELHEKFKDKKYEKTDF